jgi:hypothetical protein
MSDNNWDRMMSDWQSCKIAKLDNQKDFDDIAQLEIKTRKKARSMNFYMWSDIIATIFIIAVFIYHLTIDAYLYKQIIFGGAVVILIPMAFLSIWLRKGAWETTGNDTRAYLNLALKRSISAIQLAKANMITAAIAGPFFITVILWRGLSTPDEVQWPWNRFFFGSLLQFIIFSGMFFGARYYRKRKEVERIKLETMLDELESEQFENE